MRERKKMTTKQQEFIEACVRDNHVHDLRPGQPVDMEDCRVWGLTEKEWRACLAVARAEMIQEAVDYLQAVERKDGLFQYWDDATRTEYLVLPDDLAELVKMFDDHRLKWDAYSQWCTVTPIREA